MKGAQRQAVTQVCPNCGAGHDVGVYVSGQPLTCACGIRFEVVRHDVRPSTIGVPTHNERDGRGAAADAPPEGVLDRPAEGAVARTAAVPGPSSVQAPGDAQALDRTVPSRPKDDAATTRPSPSLTVPGYELVELLGKGGMGEVWRAKQLSLGRMVAVKLLPENLAADPEFVARFDKEATALASLSHPNIVQIIDRGRAGQHYFFAMELIVGTNLRAQLSGGRIEPRETIKVGLQVVRALEAAHEQKIVHRDLKPENILIDGRGHVKIADFGLAGMQGSEHNISLTATAVAMGTVNYMAPEQRRDAKHVDHRADLYALGVLLYEMLTGELPLGRFKLPSAKVPGVEVQFDELIGRLLETEPECRPALAHDVEIALEQLMTRLGPSLDGARMDMASPGSGLSPASGLAVGAPPPGTSVLQRPLVSTWRSIALGLLGLAALGAGLKLWPSAAPIPVTRAPAWYSDSEDELFSTVAETGPEVRLGFESADADAGEEINVHSGHWALSQGQLTATQYGDPTQSDEHSGSVIPRAYLAHRYFSADDVELQVEMRLDELGASFPDLDERAQRYGELGFRIRDTQVSLFAIPRVGLRLLWHYFTPDGREVVGDSGQDLERVQDQTPVPKGPFRLRLRLQKQKNGTTNVEAWINGQHFLRKVLEGLSGRTGKVAVGCRNLVCRFDDLKVRGQAMSRPSRRGAEPP